MNEIQLTQLVRTLQAQNAFFHEENSLLRKETEQLKARMAYLEEKLSRYEHPKNSSNSSTPPSQDPHRIKRTESLRQKSGKKPGGQKGHPGCTLELSDKADEVIEHHAAYCSVCGQDLTSVEAIFSGQRQVIDIPPIRPRIIEHRIYSRQCSCGHCQESDYPPEAHSSVCYGENLTGLTAYLHSRQYLPFERMSELFSDIFGLPISSGSLVNMVQRFTDKATKLYGIIRERIAQSQVVGADETGVNIGGKNHWAWTFQTPEATFIDIDTSRGKKVIERIFSDGFLYFTRQGFVHWNRRKIGSSRLINCSTPNCILCSRY